MVGLEWYCGALNITNTIAAHNVGVGMYKCDMYNTHITNATTVYSAANGMIVFDVSNTHIISTTALHNTV